MKKTIVLPLLAVGLLAGSAAVMAEPDAAKPGPAPAPAMQQPDMPGQPGGPAPAPGPKMGKPGPDDRGGFKGPQRGEPGDWGAYRGPKAPCGCADDRRGPKGPRGPQGFGPGAPCAPAPCAPAPCAPGQPAPQGFGPGAPCGPAAPCAPAPCAPGQPAPQGFGPGAPCGPAAPCAPAPCAPGQFGPQGYGPCGPAPCGPNFGPRMGKGQPCAPGYDMPRGPRGPRMGGMKPMDRSADRQFTPEQMAKYDAIMGEFEKKASELHDRLFVAQTVLNALENSTNPDVQTVTKTAQDVAKLRGELRALGKDVQDKLEKAGF